MSISQSVGCATVSRAAPSNGLGILLARPFRTQVCVLLGYLAKRSSRYKRERIRPLIASRRRSETFLLCPPAQKQFPVRRHVGLRSGRPTARGGMWFQACQRLIQKRESPSPDPPESSQPYISCLKHQLRFGCVDPLHNQADSLVVQVQIRATPGSGVLHLRLPAKRPNGLVVSAATRLRRAARPSIRNGHPGTPPRPMPSSPSQRRRAPIQSPPCSSSIA